MLGKSLLSLLLISIPAVRNNPTGSPRIEQDGMGKTGVEFRETIPNHPQNQRDLLQNVQGIQEGGCSSASERGLYLLTNLSRSEKQKRINSLLEDQKELLGYTNKLEIQFAWLEEIYPTECGVQSRKASNTVKKNL
ncbi:hypothetical protein PCASD_17785 [Puccinia coronata f. sp. avenae]|uniref:Uncharacterized protein n=1 Tax=Puccinia coronata f. sp. avenae TaxID=200324 RepID=A0A2N5SR20_9BASI|nr:hypothetical protein PCASD_17785 [Puccinia coronata f. sp. avenae]